MKHYKIKEDVLQATLNYLATKPFNEVFQLVAALQNPEEVKEEVKDETKVEKKK